MIAHVAPPPLSLETLSYERKGAVGVLTLNRPERLNAMNRLMLRELHRVLDVAEADDGVRALVLAGAGETFCSGFDLKEQLGDRPRGVAAWRTILQDDFDAIVRFWRFPKPTVAAVRGHCVAGGCELALCCDLTIAAEDAVFGEPELKFGAGIVVMILPWLVGAKKAKELILTGDDALQASEASRLGLVNRVVPVGEELPTALELARRLAVVDPVLMRATKAALNRTYDVMGMREALAGALELDLEVESRGSPDKAAFMDIVRGEGLRAALAWREKRFAP